MITYYLMIDDPKNKITAANYSIMPTAPQIDAPLSLGGFFGNDKISV